MTGILNSARPAALAAAAGIGLLLAACGSPAHPAGQANRNDAHATAKPATRPTGGAGAGSKPSSAAAGLAALRSNPLFTVLRDVRLPGPATGSLYADGALFTWSDAGGQASSAVFRVNPATGKITATARLAAAGVAFAGNLLWLATYSGSGSGTAPGAVVALDPATLAVVHRLKIPASAPHSGWANASIAAAGGLVWVSSAGTVYGVDPSTAAIVRQIPTPSPPPVDGHTFGPGGYQVDIAAPPDGSALWTAETPGGGGHDALQVREPASGDVIDSSIHSAGGVGRTQIAAANGYAWLAFATGNAGSYVKIDRQPGLPPAIPSASVGGSNALSVSLAARILWVYDPESRHIACADPGSGAIRVKGDLPVDDITSLPGGQISVIFQPSASTPAVVIARPKTACSQRPQLPR